MRFVSTIGVFFIVLLSASRYDGFVVTTPKRPFYQLEPLAATPSNGGRERVNGVDRSFVKKNGVRNCANLTIANGGANETNDSEVMDWSDLMRIGWDSLFGNESSYNDNDLQPADWAKIEEYWDLIMPTVSYLGTTKVSKIYKALCVAYRAHRGQMRKSGEPFIIHPVEVTLLLAGLKMDGETVISGLLHDTVEDTDLTFAEVEEFFGPTVRKIVEGETKVSKLPKQLAFSGCEHTDEQAENLRQMFVAMTDDYRIIIVKLADRLHNMRTLQFMKPEKQIKISRETIDVFAPLAHRMGIWKFKAELEEIAFEYLYPVEYKRLNKKLKNHQDVFRDLLDRSQQLLQRRLNIDPTLRQQAAKVEVFGRTKELYSLWLKMETKREHNLESISDVIGLRVVITPKPAQEGEELKNESDRGVWLCYHVLGLVQHLHGFQPVPTKVKDYISFPKPNGYQSLHTASIVDGQSIEVQIRTKTMHQVAEYGMASHWSYTDEKRRRLGLEEEDGERPMYNTPWLAAIKEWQNEDISSRDFVDSVRRELLGKRVFVFLRNGKILNLARGATIIDVAFQIHTEVGLQMTGAEINGNPVSYSYQLQNGDVVSILTGDGRPQIEWMRWANSRSTRSKLRAYFRERQRDSFREGGKILIKDYLWKYGSIIEEESHLKEPFSVSIENLDDLQRFLPGKTNLETVDDLLTTIGKKQDRNFLHKTIAKVFEVPKTKLMAAEEKRKNTPKSQGVTTAVLGGRRRALDVAKILASPAKNQNSTSQANGKTVMPGSNMWNADDVLSMVGVNTELADPEHLCKDCLPVFGDAIIGTRNSPRASIIPTVHRISCPHAQKALNKAWADNRNLELRKAKGAPPGPKVDSVSLRKQHWARNGKSETKTSPCVVPVKLEWCDYDEDKTLFFAEVVVIAEDRKLLLADCSEVVSETVEIMKTGSYTTHEHATLVFLVRVNNLERIQVLMDRLGKIRSVMSVERRFGSALNST